LRGLGLGVRGEGIGLRVQITTFLHVDSTETVLELKTENPGIV
jgi:hypothetical protein